MPYFDVKSLMVIMYYNRMACRAIFLGTILAWVLPLELSGFNTFLAGLENGGARVEHAVLADTAKAFPRARKGKQAIPIPLNDHRIKTVVIDPGHGGHDPGCHGRNSQEKHLALAIAKRVARGLEQNHPDLRVVLTRDRDVFVPLHERAQIANRSGADLFISIHCNYFPRRESISGSETYVMGLHTAQHNLEVAKRENAVILLEDDYEANYDFDPNSPTGHIMLSMFQNVFLEQSILFAEQVESHIEATNQRPSRGVKQAGFVVLKETAMPSVLIETGFLSNRKEEAYLRSEQGQQAVADAICAAFADYRLQLDGPVQLVAGPAARPQEKGVDPFDQGNGGKPAVSYCVQVAASPSPLDTRHGKWNDLVFPIQTVKEEGLYRYQARNFPTLEDARSAQSYFRKEGFKDAFIVAYRDGKKISLSEAR